MRFTTAFGPWREIFKLGAYVVYLYFYYRIIIGYMGLNIESIKNEKGQREDELFYKDYDIVTKIMINFFDI